MNGFLKDRGRWKKRILYICVAVLTFAVMSVSAFAQGLPEGDPAIMDAGVSEIQETGDIALEEPVRTEETAPEPSPEPEPTAAPEPTETAAPEPAATPEPVEEPAGGKTAEPSVETLPEMPAEEQQMETKPPAPAEETKPVYDVPAVFLKDIVAKGDDSTLALTDEQLAEIEKILPDALSPYRREVVMQAYSLVGKVHYFWGGKSTQTGWDIRWGNEAIVGSGGSTQTGTTRAYGLDCSGYVLWSLVNTEETLGASGEIEQMDKTDVSNRVGYGTAGQWEASTEIAWEEAQPGDLAFYGAPATTPRNHVGIIVGRNGEGQLLVAHCSSTQNNVVVSEAGEEGFRHIRALKLVQTREEGLPAEKMAGGREMSNGLPMFLTEAQVYEDAVKNGWNISE